MTKHSTPFEDRFWPKVDRDGPEGFHYETHESIGACWLWIGSMGANGYGQFYCGRNGDSDLKAYAHRFAYEAARGPIGLFHLDHLCRVKRCVNPAHLEPVTHAENIRRHRVAVPKTHCNHGHPFEAENLYVDARGTRRCKACARIANKAAEQARTATRTTCSRGHAFDDREVTSTGTARTRKVCLVCRAARTRLGVRGAGRAPT